MVDLNVYTCAFAFSGPDILLLRKAKPDWQAGLLNGIGGKMEGDYDIVSATVREFREETGLWDATVIEPMIYHSMYWQAYLTHYRALVYFSAFELERDAMHQAVKNTIDSKEPCVIWKTEKVRWGTCPCMPNLPFLVEMAKCLVLCPPEDRKLRQPVVPTIEQWREIAGRAP